jgi:hypothetical protein
LKEIQEDRQLAERFGAIVEPIKDTKTMRGVSKNEEFINARSFNDIHRQQKIVHE